MLNIVDSPCWEEHRKILTPSESGVAALQTFGISSSNRVGQPLRTHIHRDCVEIVFLVKGFQVYEAAGDRFSLSGWDIFVARPNEPHSSGSYPESICDIIWLQINLGGGIPFFGLEEGRARLLWETLSALPRLFTGDAALRAALLDSFFALAGSDPAERCRGELLLASALLRMSRLSRRPVPRRSDAIGEAIAYIHSHLSEPILLEDAAACCGLSLSRFKVKFKEETGATPREYINRVKIEQSKRLLENGASVTDAALELGFATPNYFASTFRKYTGRTPSSYRSGFFSKAP